MITFRSAFDCINWTICKNTDSTKISAKKHFHEQGGNSCASVIKSDLSQIFLTILLLLFEVCLKERIHNESDGRFPCLLTLRNIQHSLAMSEGKSTLDFHTRENYSEKRFTFS